MYLEWELNSLTDSVLFQIRNGSGLQGNFVFFLIFVLTSIVQLFK